LRCGRRLFVGTRAARAPNDGEAFLRGFQTTDAAGTARFLTIYPGCYPGRAVHVHFKIRTADAPRGVEFTSQLYFDEALSERVYAAAPYASQRRQRLANGDDFLFRDGGKQLLLDVTPESEGYAAVFDIGLRV
jgi:protocatechuate 3,4-dioxygenase beta subunit